ncbi:MAG: DNA polymerase III subunit delta [Chloroflexi bacterium]|nr:DNA polymerase III subunit delta [Chloroflexota bacterium]
MVYVLCGDDDFSRTQFLAGLKRDLVSDDSGLLPANLTVLAGSQLRLEDLAQVCSAYPFLAEKRLVIVEGLLSRFARRPPEREVARSERQAGEMARWRQGLAEYVPRIPPTTLLAFVDGKLGRDNPLLQTLGPLAEVREFAPLDDKALPGWVQRQVSQAGGKISPQAARLLTEAVGANLWAMSNEVDKLLTYCRDRTIEAADVPRLVSEARQATVFAFVDSVLEGPRSRALSLLHKLLREGATSPQLTGMVSRQLRLVLLAQEMAAQRVGLEEMGRRLGLAYYPRRKTWEQAHRLPKERLLWLYDQLLELDVATKTGRRSEETAWEVLVVAATPQ